MNFAGTIHINRSMVLLTCGFLILVALLYRSSNWEMRQASQLIKDMQKINLKHLFSAAIDAAERGGQQVYMVRTSTSLNQKSKGKTEEGANDPLTDGDVKSHMQMFYSLKNLYPNIEIISEEKSSINAHDIPPANMLRKESVLLKTPDHFVDSQDIVIWIDPLDATQEYTEDLRDYVTTMVCIAIKGRPTIGVIHKPFQNITSWAWLDVASNIKAHEKPDKIPDPVKIIVSRSHKGQVEKVAKDAFGESSIITGAGGAGFKSLEVVKGKQDIYVHTTLIKKWDICAPNVIMEYFNGELTTLSGDVIDFGATTDSKNPGGVVAALHYHGYYLNKLQALNS